MGRIACVTPNWRKARSRLPTDTIRPPISFPIEWAYVAADSPDVLVVDAYSADEEPQETVRLFKEASVDLVILSSTPSYLFWRCPPLDVRFLCQYCAP